jgi:hypothetical protein
MLFILTKQTCTITFIYQFTFHKNWTKKICNLERLVLSLENIFFLELRYVTYSPFKHQSTKKIIEKIVGRRILILLVYLNILPRYRRSFKSTWIIPIFLHWFLSEINKKKRLMRATFLHFLQICLIWCWNIPIFSHWFLSEINTKKTRKEVCPRT